MECSGEEKRKPDRGVKDVLQTWHFQRVIFWSPMFVFELKEHGSLFLTQVYAGIFSLFCKGFVNAWQVVNLGLRTFSPDTT